MDILFIHFSQTRKYPFDIFSACILADRSSSHKLHRTSFPSRAHSSTEQADENTSTEAVENTLYEVLWSYLNMLSHQQASAQRRASQHQYGRGQDTITDERYTYWLDRERRSIDAPHQWPSSTQSTKRLPAGLETMFVATCGDINRLKRVEKTRTGR